MKIHLIISTTSVSSYCGSCEEVEYILGLFKDYNKAKEYIKE